MPRRARLRLPGYPLHIVQRGIDKAACFFDASDRGLYLGLLSELSRRCNCAVHAYVLMTNHVHLLVTPRDVDASTFMKGVAQRYSQYVNRKLGRTGPLWEGRFRSNIVDSEGYALKCQRYIELNPVRAAMVNDPAAYQWSSFGANGLGQSSLFLEPHHAYLRLGEEREVRLRAYRMYCGKGSDARELEEIRSAVNAGYALGSTEFLEALAKRFGKSVVRVKTGPKRPGTPN